MNYPIKITELATRRTYEIRPVRAGENSLPCPVCSSERKKKQARCFVWNVQKGVGFCHHCQSSFTVATAMRQRAQKQFVVPSWKNDTLLSDKALQWFESRMISKETVRRMNIVSDRIFMPQSGSLQEVIAYPYLRGQKVVNIKYRGPQKSFRMVRGAEMLFYNYNCIADSRELIICEGEMDALSFIDAGFDYVVSVPNGAGSSELEFLDRCFEDLQHVETFYIAVDYDEAGLRLRNELVRRLSPEKCRIVTYLGYKDANELYVREGGTALKSIVENAVEVPISGIVDLDRQYDNISTLFREGMPPGKRTGIAPLDSLVAWETGKLVVWTGIPSHGKSEMVDFISVRMNVLHGWKTAFFSPENFPVGYHFSKIAEKLTGRRFREGEIPPGMFEQLYDYMESNFFFISPEEQTAIDDVLPVAEQLVRRKGIRHLVIDPFNCLENRRNPGESETDYIGRFLDLLSRFARKHELLISLVAHPRKMGRIDRQYEVPTLYDINGSANFFNKADYGITVYRDFERERTAFIVQKVRWKHLGRVGESELMYDLTSGRFYPVGASPDNGEYLCFVENNHQDPSLYPIQ